MSFKDAIQDDIPIFTEFEEFAIKATYKGVDINILFDLESDDSEEILLPTIHARSLDVPNLAKGDTFIVEGVNYKVLDWYDLTGLKIISLNKEQF